MILSGKSTLLKHILESKRNDGGDEFRCAVIVNDMAVRSYGNILFQCDRHGMSFLSRCNISRNQKNMMSDLLQELNIDGDLIESTGLVQSGMYIMLFYSYHLFVVIAIIFLYQL